MLRYEKPAEFLLIQRHFKGLELLFESTMMSKRHDCYKFVLRFCLSDVKKHIQSLNNPIKSNNK